MNYKTNIMKTIALRILERWEKPLVHYSNTPILQYSNIPLLRYDMPIKKIERTINVD